MGEDEVEGVPLAIVCVTCVTLTGVLSKFLSFNKVGNRLVAWTYFPHREHGRVTLTVRVPFVIGDFNLG